MKSHNLILALALLSASSASLPLCAQGQNPNGERNIVNSNESGTRENRQPASPVNNVQPQSGIFETSYNQRPSLVDINTVKRLLDNPTTQSIGYKNLISNITNYNDAKSYNLLGDLYRYGKGSLVQKNIDNAIVNYKKADSLGDCDAACSLGFIYLSGENGTVDEKNGVDYMIRAAKSNNVAQFNVGYMYENGMFNQPVDISKAKSYYEMAAKQGNMDAVCALGIIYFYGSDGSMPNQNLGAKYLQSAADAGITDAYTTLGIAYLEGRGTPKNTEKGIHYLELGDQNDNPQASYQLGTCYENGIGVKQNLNKAFNYYSKAANHSYSNASEKVVELQDKITKQANVGNNEVLRKINAVTPDSRKNKKTARKR